MTISVVMVIIIVEGVEALKRPMSSIWCKWCGEVYDEEQWPVCSSCGSLLVDDDDGGDIVRIIYRSSERFGG